jgi:hypothetical protein
MFSEAMIHTLNIPSVYSCLRVLFSDLGLAEVESAEVVNLIGSGCVNRWRFSESAMTVVATTTASEQDSNTEECKIAFES